MVVQEEEEANLYDDLVLSSQSASDQFSFQSILTENYQAELKAKDSEISLLKQHVSTLEEQIQNISFNMQVVYNTTKEEIIRKDAIIAQLNEQLSRFRRKI